MTIAVDLSDRQQIAATKLKPEAQRERIRLELRAIRLARKAARLPLNSNGRHKITAQSERYHAIADMLNSALQGNTTTKIHPAGDKRLTRATQLLHELQQR